MKQFNVIFDGYWLEDNKSDIPEFSGVYIIYRCSYVPHNDTVDLIEILYIGQADNLRGRISQHSIKEFQVAIRPGETLCYACAPIDDNNLDLVENGLVFVEQPPFNVRLKDNYSHEDAEFIIGGNCGLLKNLHFSLVKQ